MPSARDTAYEILCDWIAASDNEKGSGNVTRDLAARLDKAALASNERSLAVSLVNGVIQRRATLEHLWKPHVRRAIAQVETGAQLLLSLGSYQLALLSGAPDYAVVNETIETARRKGEPRWAGFLNAVLRKVAQSVTDERLEKPSAYALPLAEGGYRRLTEPLFPDPQIDPCGYFAAAFSFPDWIAARWAGRNDFAELMRLGFWFNGPPTICLRVNRLKANRAQLLEALGKAGFAAREGLDPAAVWLDRATRVETLPGFDAGWFAVQDESALSAAVLLAPLPGQRVLDLCAAPGGKTTHLAELMQNSGSILAVDVDERRLARIRNSCRRLGIDIVKSQMVRRDATELAAGSLLFDRALVDVPCSNTGVLGKRPEVRWRLRPQDLEELPALQGRLLRTAARHVAPAGQLVYSTCSIEREENRQVVDAFLLENPNWTLVGERTHVPGQPADGGYQALLRHA
jgi:16S rRNA (cytosine967-C5)-methyltransferase